jgi:hypothetical protein
MDSHKTRNVCWYFTTDSLPWGYPGQLFRLRRMLNSKVNARDCWFIMVWALVISNNLYVQSALTFTLDWLLWSCSSFLQGAHSLSLYRERQLWCDHSPSQILKKVSWSNYRRYFLLGNRLVWSILLGIGVNCRFASSVRQAGQAGAHC